MPEAPDEVQMPLTSQLPPNVWLPCRTLVITLSHGFCLFLVPPTPPFNHAPLRQCTTAAAWWASSEKPRTRPEDSEEPHRSKGYHAGAIPRSTAQQA
jgi:hypothetical protein